MQQSDHRAGHRQAQAMRQDLAGKLAEKQKSEGLDHGGRLSEHLCEVNVILVAAILDPGIGLRRACPCA